MKLSILVPSVLSRRNTFLPRILNILFSQYDNLSPDKQKMVEIIVLLDNKSIMLGEKRNIMIDDAKGEYVVFVDDDDLLADDYIEQLLDATYSDADTIVFMAEVTINGGEPKICYYSSTYKCDNNTDDAYYRLPNHICATKRSIASKIEFPSILYGEDSAYSKLLKTVVTTEYKIDKVLYYYNFNSETTETQNILSGIRRFNRELIPSILDLIILSNAKDDSFKKMTENAILTAIENSSDYKINVIVMEQNSSVFYDGVKTVHYNYPFNYNKVANEGVRLGDAHYVMIANNDLLFRAGWLFELFVAEYGVVSPRCPNDPRQSNFSVNTMGYEVAKHFSGWCFMIKRALFNEIGGFDEDFEFWFADNAVVKQLEAIGIEPMIVPKSLVVHLGSKTLNSLPEQEKRKITYGQADKFNEKYNENHFK